MARDKGDGSIYPRCSRKGPSHAAGDHRQCTIDDWVGQVENGRYPNGRRRYARVVRKTKAEVREALKELQGNVDAGITPDKTRTVSTYLDWWADEVLPTTGVNADTVQRYKWVIGKNITPNIGKVRLGVLAPTHVQAMLTKLERQGLAPRTRSQVRTVLRRALAWAEHTGGLVARNAAAAVDGPRLGGSKIDDRLSADQAKAVLAAAKGDRLEALAVLALRLGLRRGEALALKWADVDLDNKTLKVIDAKTPSGKRTIPLVAGTAAALRERRRRQAGDQLAAGPLWGDEGWVFTWEDGRPISGRSALKWWHGMTEKAELGRRRFHASRHTAATLMLDAGVPLEVVSAVLGHANLSITADIYAEVTQDSKRRALAKLDQALGG